MLRAMRRAVDLERFYPETDHMGEAELHRFIADMLRTQLAAFLGTSYRVGENQFFCLKRGDPTERCAPDVYVLRGVKGPLVRSWKAWLLPSPPVFSFEIVSSDSLKDYVEAPVAQARLGTKELVVYDPEGRGKRDRNVWRVHCRRKDGFYLVSASDDDRIRSESLGCWLRIVGRGDDRRIRVATGRNGEKLVATPEEMVEAAREAAKVAKAESDAAKVARDVARAERDAATAERDAALAEIARMKAHIRRERRPRREPED
jgi:Uma2 family endonuclease